MAIPTRLPDVKSLYEILPRGTEGGKEFARIVDLLLYYDAQRNGKNIRIFSDVAGDYNGLDSFEDQYFREHEAIGYQYKFFSSPLSSKHRKDIEKSLKRVAERQEKLKLSKWILVIPEDLMESSTRKDGGDVSWFEGLRCKHNLQFEIDYWGHKKLVSLFLENPTICLYYYPELVPEGVMRKKSIQETRKRYNDGLVTLYRNIEFVGMSVYKQEATKGVPMEHIYIPLHAIPEGEVENDETSTRINPLSFLTPGAKTIVLGDPGSGKSTLLKFLSLSGFSKAIQERYKAKQDNRLPILVTLRLYADELKSRTNLALIDYIQENVQGHFNLKSADESFFEYYLESGQAILFFDGLDELPTPQFKKFVRDQIRTLITINPLNTIIVTSRIVGYENPFKFDNKEFYHTKLTHLQLPEIEQFVKDWYRVRIENRKERDDNVSDLVRILKDDDYSAIRELAQNPLLLTIIALVHRIDAVLPDERVVLYQKCTETLMNTWHTWKFREKEVKNRGKIERRNRRRMEAIAYWMHCRSGSVGRDQRAVIPYSELKNFLTDHIINVEKSNDPNNDPEDLADQFIEFIKKKAGLIIEIGDDQYSFVHLTFQEYLTASYIITSNEKDGASGIWNSIRDCCADTRWHEVIRLLVSELKSEDSQEYIITEMLGNECMGSNATLSLLLVGLLIDGIESAESRKEEIFKRLINYSIISDQTDQFKPIISSLRACLKKEAGNEKMIKSAIETISQNAVISERINLALITLSLNRAESKIFSDWSRSQIQGTGRAWALYCLFFDEVISSEMVGTIKDNIEIFYSIQDILSLRDPSGNFISAIGQSISYSMGKDAIAKRAFQQQIVALMAGFSGPFFELMLNTLEIAYNSNLSIKLVNDLNQPLSKTLNPARNLIIHSLQNTIKNKYIALKNETHIKLESKKIDVDKLIDPFRFQKHSMTYRIYPDAFLLGKNEEFWQRVLSNTNMVDSILELLTTIFEMEPKAYWKEALRSNYIAVIPQRIILFEKSLWKEVETAFIEQRAGKFEKYFAAWQLILDAWLKLYLKEEIVNRSIFDQIVKFTRDIDEPCLIVAHCIRDYIYGDKDKLKELIEISKSQDIYNM